MKKINRRSFLGKTSAGLGSALALSSLSLPSFLKSIPELYDMTVGFQTFPIRDKVAKDFPGTMKMMAGQGFQIVEMCSPVGYATIGFGPLVAIKPADMKKIITDSGLNCPSCHFGFGELTDHLDERIEWSNQLGLSQMICSTFWLPKTVTLNDYLAAADRQTEYSSSQNKKGRHAGRISQP